MSILSQTEFRLTQICEGVKTRQEVIDETLDEYREMYIKTKRGFGTFVEVGQNASGSVSPIVLI